jgi:group II intron reverse transcriptase/maturase
VHLDLDAFFDRVNHARLIRRLYLHLPERGLVQLINHYLKAGVWIEGRRTATTEGVPQGGPLSPVLSNVVLDELDWELEQRGHHFARYADDCNVFVSSRRAGERVLASLQRFIAGTLRLKVNIAKSAVDRPCKRSFLGFTFSRKGAKVKVAAKAIERLKRTVRALSLRTRGHSLLRIIRDLREPLLGWKAYFDLAEVLSPLRDLDKWLRRRLRCYQWKQWGRAGYRELRKRGVSVRLAWNTSKSAHGPWRISHSPALYLALPTRYFRDLGLPELAAR